MNRIYRLVFNRATGAMQVASELASGMSSPARTVGATRRRSPLGVAVMAALCLGTAAAPSAFAVPYDFTSDEVIGDTRVYADGFFIGNTGTVAIDLVGGGQLTSNGLVSLGTVAGADGTLRVIGPTAYLQMTGAALRIGEAGTGTLQLLDGGTATSNNTVSLGYGAGGTGNALVRGADSSLTARQLLVGRQGSGIKAPGKVGEARTTGAHGTGHRQAGGGRKGMIRPSVPSLSMNWCFTAPATCSSTRAAISIALRSCQGLIASASALSTGTKSGSGSTPNQTIGTPAAELSAQPSSGTMKNSAYSRWWVACAARACQPGMATSAGGRWVMRQASRTKDSSRMVTPAHLCQL